MKLVIFFVVVLSVFSVAFSAIARLPKDPSKPGHCYSKETGPLNNGQEKPLSGTCGKAVCSSDGTLLFESCGVVAGPHGSSKPNLSKPYPNCCPRPI